MASKLFFTLSTLIAFTSSRMLCPRIFFQNIDENTMPYKVIEGVYIEEDDYHNNFPVFRLENGSLLFYHTVDNEGKHYLVFGVNLKNYFGVAARLYRDPSSLLSSETLFMNDIFFGIVSHWEFYNPRDQTTYDLSTSSSSKIKAVCVDNDFRECNSDRVYLSKNLKDKGGIILNDPAKDFFYRIHGMFRNLRPGYKHSANTWYLQYVDGHWVVTGSNRPRNSEDQAYLRVKDFALRPEYISKNWSIYYNGWAWIDMPDLRVLCRGNKANCISQCSVNKQCPTPQPKVNTELHIVYLGKRPGDLGMAFCSGSHPSTRYYLCVPGRITSYWSGQGSSCSATDPTALGTPKAKPAINFDDNPSVVPAVITVAVLMQILLPCVLWNCALCKKEDDESSVDQAGEELEKRLQRVSTAENQEELYQDMKEYRQALKEFKKECKEEEPKDNASLCRIISMDAFFSFYLWLIYYIGCGVTQCTNYGSVFEILRVFAIVMLCLSPVIVLLESCVSHELDYLSNIMKDETALGYIQRMRQVPPKINMVVECYHNETRTEIVHYRDAKGNRKSRTETTVEKVVTYTDRDEFSFGSWVDASERELSLLSTVALNLVKIDSSIVFGDQETADDYVRQVAALLARNRHRDEFTDYSSSKEIPGLMKRISAYVDLRVKPFWIRPRFFWIATLLQMTWPYRWLFRLKTAKTHYALVKKMYKSITPPIEVELMDTIAVLSENAFLDANPSSPDNNCPGYPMSVMNNPGGGNPTIQNGGTAYQPVDLYLKQDDLTQGLCTPYPPHNSESAGPSSPPCPAVSQPNAPLPSDVTVMNYPSQDSGAQCRSPGSYNGPAFPAYPARPLPSASPPSYETAVCNNTQPDNKHKPPIV